MIQENIYSAKTQLSRLIEKALEGEEVVIAKAGKPVARLVPYTEKNKPVRYGSLKGKITIADDFDEYIEEVRERLDSGYPRFVSSISFAEIEIKRSQGILVLPADYRDSLEDIGLSPLEYTADDTLFLAGITPPILSP